MRAAKTLYILPTEAQRFVPFTFPHFYYTRLVENTFSMDIACCRGAFGAMKVSLIHGTTQHTGRDLEGMPYMQMQNILRKRARF